MPDLLLSVEIKIKKITQFFLLPKVIIRAPLGCVCRQCTDVSEVQPQEFASYLGNKDQFEESIAFV